MADLIDLYNSVYTTLTADVAAGSFYDDVGGRIWLVDGPAQETLPHCIWTPVTDLLEGYFDTDADDIEFVFQIDLYGVQETSTPEALLATNDKLIALLDRTNITVANWNCGKSRADPAASRGTLSRDGDAWVINSQWIITASE